MRAAAARIRKAADWGTAERSRAITLEPARCGRSVKKAVLPGILWPTPFVSQVDASWHSGRFRTEGAWSAAVTCRPKGRHDEDACAHADPAAGDRRGRSPGSQTGSE